MERKSTSDRSSEEEKSPIPDTSRWKPRDVSETLFSILSKECAGAELKLLGALQHERQFNVDNFESGVPFEELVRSEIQRLLPRRYSVTSGRVLDRLGRTAGRCDIVIFNDRWFSPVKPPATQSAIGAQLPVEGVYAVGEVKQTLTLRTLDEAMEKLVNCHRLHRPRTYAHRIVENREGAACPHGLTNPLFSFIFAGGISPNEKIEDLIDRFFEISKQLKRLEVVRLLCVLGKGCVTWAFSDPLNDAETRPALFVEADLFHPIFPIFSPASHRSALLFLVQTLTQSLFHVILAPEDLAFAYGSDANGIKIPANKDIFLPVEDEWGVILNQPCSNDHDRR